MIWSLPLVRVVVWLGQPDRAFDCAVILLAPLLAVVVIGLVGSGTP